MEDVDAESAWSSSRPIRSAMYAMLLEGSRKTVSERVRVEGHKFGEEVVEVASSSPLPFSEVLKGADAAKRRKVLFDVLGEAPANVPDNLVLAAACVRYWIKKQAPITSVEVAAVLATMLQRDEDKVGDARHSSCTPPAQLSCLIPHSPCPVLLFLWPSVLFDL